MDQDLQSWVSKISLVMENLMCFQEALMKQKPLDTEKESMEQQVLRCGRSSLWFLGLGCRTTR